MKQWYEMYGQDADGNRGIKTLMWELEDTEEERDQIAELLILKGYTVEDEGRACVELDGINIDVEVVEYHDEIRKLEGDL